MDSSRYTAFVDQRCLATGTLSATLSAVKQEMERGCPAPILIFDDSSGKQVDFDLRGSLDEALARIAPAEPKRGRGRPSLGVASGEVSLFPRHWEWLQVQQGNVSATLRKLVEAAMRDETSATRVKRAVEALDRMMWSLAGDLPGCEEASRALYARDFARYRSLVADWPGDLGTHFSRSATEAEAAGR